MEQLPRDVLIAIDRVLSPGGSFQSNSQDVSESLNQLFPDESALAEIKKVQETLLARRLAMQQEVDRLVDLLKQDQDPERMQLIQENISDLLTQMTQIREKATESEAIVRNITKEIQMLDNAKKNLTLSMTALKRFQMLVNALEQLDGLLKERKYGDMAQTLGAVKQIATFFRPYTSVDRIALAWKRIQEFQGRARTIVEEDFDAFVLQDSVQPVQVSRMNELCLLVDALGDDFRVHLIERYCAMELKEYRRIFKPAQEAGGLDNISRRFAWFRRTLNTYEEEEGKVFLSTWEVGPILCAKFSEITSEDMATLLAKEGPKLSVALLLESMQQCLEFELSIARKYGIPFGEIVKKSPNPARAARTISSVFEKHMSVFVDAQDRALSDMLSSYRGPNSRTSVDGNATEQLGATVLPSSTELFYFYAQTLDQCSKFTTGSALYDLVQVFKKWLRIYADDILVAPMKRPELLSRERRSMDTRFSIHSMQMACTVLNTADYCHNTATELEEKLKEKIDEAYREKITLQPELDLFIGVISSSITQVLRDLEATVEPFLLTMTRTTWATLESVSGQQAHVIEMVAAVDSYVEVTKSQLEQKKYLRNFYDKAAALLITKFTNAMVKSRPMREIGAEQLLLDLQALKACLLRLPSSPSQPEVPQTYIKMVTKSTTHLETILKIVLAPVEPHDAFIHNYILLIGDSSFSNFQKILDLKGTPRPEQNHLLDKFLTITSTKSDLASTSHLSNLDMDPGNTSQVAANEVAATSVNLFAEGSKGERKEVFSNLRNLVSFAVRRDRETSK